MQEIASLDKLLSLLGLITSVLAILLSLPAFEVASLRREIQYLKTKPPHEWNSYFRS